MSLPSIPRASFTYQDPIALKKSIRLYPFTVGHESILLQAKESEDPRDQMNAITQVIEECSEGAIKVDETPVFVIEDIFLRLRERSIGETQDIQYRCNASADGQPCGHPIAYTLDFRNIKVKVDPEHTLTFQVTDDIGVKMRYPMFKDYRDRLSELKDNEALALLIDSIFQGDEVWHASETPNGELIAFFESFPLSAKMAIADKYMSRMPKIHLKDKLVCPKCGHEHSIEFNSIADVFQ